MIVPPPEYGFAHDLPLEEYEWTLREYLELVPDERGEWKSMSDFANEILE